MKNLIPLILLLALSMGLVHAQKNDDKHALIHVSFTPYLSTNGKDAKEYTNDFSFNILWGNSKNENALAFAGLANIIGNKANGVQLAGLANLIGEEANGLQFAGLANVIGGDARGIQFAGLANLSGTSSGVQFAGLANVAGVSANGLQFAGLANIASEGSGIQFAGIGNIANSYNGWQFAGIGNMAEDVSGSQFAGIINIAKNVKGVQVAGLINIAENSDYPIGLINLIKNGEKSIGISYNETGTASATFRSGGRVLYGIIGLGYNHKSPKTGLTLEGGFGAHWNISPQFRINNELRSSMVNVFNKDKVYHESLSILPAFKISPKIEIFAGPSLNFMHSNNMNNMDIFPNHHIWKNNDYTNPKRLYIGCSLGIHYIF